MVHVKSHSDDSVYNEESAEESEEGKLKLHWPQKIF